MTEEGVARLCAMVPAQILCHLIHGHVSMHIHTDAQISPVQRAAIQLLNHKQMGSTA